MTEEFINTTLTMLQNRSARIMLKQIAAELSSIDNERNLHKKECISYEWICKFNQGKIDKPDHPKVEAKIQRLFEYLVSKVGFVS